MIRENIKVQCLDCNGNGHRGELPSGMSMQNFNSDDYQLETCQACNGPGSFGFEALEARLKELKQGNNYVKFTIDRNDEGIEYLGEISEFGRINEQFYQVTFKRCPYTNEFPLNRPEQFTVTYENLSGIGLLPPEEWD